MVQTMPGKHAFVAFVGHSPSPPPILGGKEHTSTVYANPCEVVHSSTAATFSGCTLVSLLHACSWDGSKLLLNPWPRLSVGSYKCSITVCNLLFWHLCSVGYMVVAS